jgi:hypothetical protein
MSERLQWRTLYGEKNPPGRPTLFLDGEGLGDYYQATGDVWRVRVWSPGRLQGGWERLVLTEEAARGLLLRMAERALATEGGE